MNFLLTNDDGVTAPGLWAAAGALAELGRVLIVAPSGNCSGFGPAYPPGQSLSFFPYRNGGDHPAGVTAFGLNATPATCAHAGLSGIFGVETIDLVVSGVNEGANMGRDVFYSGTVGAALTAHFLGKTAIAVSLVVEPGRPAHWESARQVVRDVVDMCIEEERRAHRSGQTAPSPALYNVNVPNRVAADLRGLRMTGLSAHSFLPATRFERASDQALIRRAEHVPPLSYELWSDAWAVAQGHISVTPLQPAQNALSAQIASADLWTAPAALLEAMPQYALGSH